MIQSNIKRIMEQKGVTYAKLEALTGLSSQTITRARGPRIREVGLGTLETIAQALGVKTKETFEEYAPEKPDGKTS